MTLSRRTLMQALGGAAVAPASAKVMLAKHLASPSTALLLSGAKEFGCGPVPTTDRINPLWSSIRILTEDLRREQEEKEAFRYRPFFDGDINSLRSVSLVNKQRLQLERDRETKAIIAQAGKLIGW